MLWGRQSPNKIQAKRKHGASKTYEVQMLSNGSAQCTEVWQGTGLAHELVVSRRAVLGQGFCVGFSAHSTAPMASTAGASHLLRCCSPHGVQGGTTSTLQGDPCPSHPGFRRPWGNFKRTKCPKSSMLAAAH